MDNSTELLDKLYMSLDGAVKLAIGGELHGIVHKYADEEAYKEALLAPTEWNIILENKARGLSADSLQKYMAVQTSAYVNVLHKLALRIKELEMTTESLQYALNKMEG